MRWPTSGRLKKDKKIKKKLSPAAYAAGLNEENVNRNTYKR